VKPRDVTEKTWQPREQQFEIESKWGINVFLGSGGDDVAVTILSEFGQATLSIPKGVFCGMSDFFLKADEEDLWSSHEESRTENYGRPDGPFGSEWQIDLCTYVYKDDGKTLGGVRVPDTSVSIHYSSTENSPAFFVFTVEDFRSIVKWYNSEME
jgi:hypothetical protein